jgi:saccharopine dehydrogenase-like NADP-dependent oxidoreductase
VAVLGAAGAMGRAAVHRLARDGRHVLALDTDLSAVRRIVRRYGGGRATAETADARDRGRLARQLTAVGAVVNCAPYPLNLDVMRAALDARCHYVDLGGLFHMTRRQRALDAEFRRARLLAVLGMGSAPGITNLMAVAAARGLRRVRSVLVYNGGADHTRYDAPLAFGFAPATVLDEMVQPAVVFAGGRFRSVPPLTLARDHAFPGGTQHAHATLHSEVATLPLAFAARGLRECAFFLAHDPVQLERLRLLIGLGLTDAAAGPRGVAPRDVLLDALRRLPPPPDFVDDRDFLSVVVEGARGGRTVTVRADLTATPQRRPPLSAVARDTGFPPAIVAGMVLDGRIRERGVRAPEECVPVRPFFDALGLPLRLS